MQTTPSHSGPDHPERDEFHTRADHSVARPDPRTWPFGDLTDQQLRQRSALECAMRAGRLAPPQLCVACGAILRTDSRAFAPVESDDGLVCPACDETAMADALELAEAAAA
jgi:hypothetical protein